MVKPLDTPPCPTPAEVLAARKSAGLTQVAAAALVYVVPRTWQHYESGQRRMQPGLWELFQYKASP